MPDAVRTIRVHLVDVVSFQKVANIIEAGKLMADALATDPWCWDEREEYCHWCNDDKPEGHADDCKREIALAAWKAITKGVE